MNQNIFIPLHTLHVRVIGKQPENDRDYHVNIENGDPNARPWPTNGLIVIEADSASGKRQRLFSGQFDNAITPCGFQSKHGDARACTRPLDHTGLHSISRTD